MKKFLLALSAILALTVAGIAWADSPATPVSEVAEPPAQATVPVETPAVDATPDLEGVVFAPLDVLGNPACRIICRETWGACMNACPGGAAGIACEQGCTATLSACLDACWGK